MTRPNEKCPACDMMMETYSEFYYCHHCQMNLPFEFYEKLIANYKKEWDWAYDHGYAAAIKKYEW